MVFTQEITISHFYLRSMTILQAFTKVGHILMRGLKQQLKISHIEILAQVYLTWKAST